MNPKAPQASPEKQDDQSEVVSQNLDQLDQGTDTFIKKYEREGQEWLRKNQEYQAEIKSMTAASILRIIGKGDKGMRVIQNAYFEEMAVADDDSVIQEGFMSTVNFRGNQQAERYIGAGNLLPPTIRVVEVTDREGQKRTGIRKSSPRVGYYDERGYIPIFSGYHIKALNESEFETYRSTQNGAFDSFRSSQDQYTEGRNLFTDFLKGYSLALPNDPQAREKIIHEEQASHTVFLARVETSEKKERQSNFIHELWSKASSEAKTTDEVIKNYIAALDRAKTNNENTLSTAEWDDLLRDANNMKEAFATASIQNRERMLDWMKQGGMTPELFSGKNGQESVAMLEKIDQGEMDPESLRLLGTREGRYYRQYMPDIMIAHEATGVPMNVMIQIMIREGSHGDPHAGPGTSSAVGLGQMIDATWEQNKPEGGERYNPSHQIMAMAKYLQGIQSRQNCDWTMAAVYYHTGEGGASQENLEAYMRANPAIVRMMTEKTPQGYMEAAKRYYEEGARLA